MRANNPWPPGNNPRISGVYTSTVVPNGMCESADPLTRRLCLRGNGVP